MAVVYLSLKSVALFSLPLQSQKDPTSSLLGVYQEALTLLSESATAKRRPNGLHLAMLPSGCLHSPHVQRQHAALHEGTMPTKAYLPFHGNRLETKLVCFRLGHLRLADWAHLILMVISITLPSTNNSRVITDDQTEQIGHAARFEPHWLCSKFVACSIANISANLPPRLLITKEQTRDWRVNPVGKGTSGK